jgi:hypothetical protein
MFEVKASLTYPGGRAHLSRNVRFGEKEAEVQERYEPAIAGPPAPRELPVWAWAALAAALLAIGGLAIMLRRERARARLI